VLDAMHLVSLGMQKCGEVSIVLPGNSRDQRSLQTSISFTSSARHLSRAFRSARVGLARDVADARGRTVPMPQPFLDYGTRRSWSYRELREDRYVSRKKRLCVNEYADQE